MHVVEKVGSGVPRMRELMKDAGLPKPIFSTKGFFTVSFMKRVKQNSANDDRLNDRLNDRLTSREKKYSRFWKRLPA